MLAGLCEFLLRKHGRAAVQQTPLRKGALHDFPSTKVGRYLASELYITVRCGKIDLRRFGGFVSDPEQDGETLDAFGIERPRFC